MLFTPEALARAVVTVSVVLDGHTRCTPHTTIRIAESEQLEVGSLSQVTSAVQFSRSLHDACVLSHLIYYTQHIGCSSGRDMCVVMSRAGFPCPAGVFVWHHVEGVGGQCHGLSGPDMRINENPHGLFEDPSVRGTWAQPCDILEGELTAPAYRGTTRSQPRCGPGVGIRSAFELKPPNPGASNVS